MSGLIALLDDVAGIAKIAAASVDDVAAGATKAGVKAAGAVIDDAAVTPKYVHGFDASREVPIVWKIAKGSIFNKVVILLPVALLLSEFAPWAIAPLLMLGGGYLCFEGAEKVYHALSPPHDAMDHYQGGGNPTQLEKEKVAGAIKTDFILSAEIMTIALSTIPLDAGLLMKAMTLFLVAVAITAAVYGFVALVVKADDFGMHLAQRGGGLARFGRGIVKFMPGFMTVLMIVGTAAMIWVGGNIVIHGLHELGIHQPYQGIHDRAVLAAQLLPALPGGLVRWFVTAFFDGIFGLILGMILIPLSQWIILPVAQATIVPAMGAVKGLFGRRREA
ncbi:DUF808 family protein [Paracoccus sp. S-4012]|uniref:DUF808 domain-containing protein n=1 Tax=Paracoccus sp. S-4012 TaxID=2665648 RepID=UPI0012B07C49|nr:DUF808 domain-containing protein [Paracoccus sp. S-4012]MRX49334.1 DUF808 family protein [Paracoccus sp. S-4012]